MGGIEQIVIYSFEELEFSMSYEHEKHVAIKAVLDAATLCEKVRATIVPTAMEKHDRSPVTVADYGSQAIICRYLSEAFPNDVIIAEEDSAALREVAMAEPLSQVTRYVQAILPDTTADTLLQWIDRGNGQLGDRYWTLDPIDGTKGFLRGDQYAIALALVEAGEVKVGVLACPALSIAAETGLLFVAVRGEGATMQAIDGGALHPIRVSYASEGETLRCVEGVEASHSNHAQQEELARALGITAPSLRIDSQAKYGIVASGQAALYLRLPSAKTPDYREKIWDHAAGSILVEEAGGKVTDMHGQPLNFSLGRELVNNQGVIVSNGDRHDTVLSMLHNQVQP